MVSESMNSTRLELLMAVCECGEVWHYHLVGSLTPSLLVLMAVCECGEVWHYHLLGSLTPSLLVLKSVCE